MKTGVVNNKFLVSQIRLDGKFNLSEGLQVRKLVHKSPWGITSINEVTSDIYCPGIFHRHYVSSGIPFLGGADIQKQEINSDKFLCKATTPNWKILEIKRGWTLVTCGGTIGLTAFANNLFTKCWVSQHVMRVIPSSIKEGMLYAYLSSKYGHLLLTTNTYGSVIPTLNADNIGSLPIPLFPESFQTEVDNLIQESARLREEANDKLEEAIEYFNEHYPIKDGIQQYFYKKVSELKNGFAAYNNNLEVDDYIRSYSSNSFIVGDEAEECFAPPMFKHIYLLKDNGYPFMTGSELQRFNLRYYRWLSPRGVKDINDYVVHKGTLLLYKSGTTDGGILGNVFIVDNLLDGCCLSDHVIRVVFKDLKKAYWTYAFLKSKGGKRILIRLATGTMIPFITPEKLSDIPIPNPDGHYEKVIQDIEECIDKSSRAKVAENKAITMVEDESEKWNKAN